MIKSDRLEEKPDKDIIQPLTTTSLPPQTPESSVGVEHQEQIYLPPQEHASAYAQRYFDEVHCLYWLFPPEQFHERVHETYMTGGVIASASWLCCLYSIFAIGSAGAEIPGQKKSTEFLVMAKALVPQVNDEADVDSIRALCLLALALQVECHTNAAYLYIGTAVRTAYSLGLHVDKAPPSRGHLEREQNRRIWWTLYLLDYEIAHRYGNPCAVLDEQHDNNVQMPSEQILGPGPTTPPGFLAAASSLCRLSRRIRASLHATTPRARTPPSTISLATIEGLLAAMRAWLASLPPHLSALAHTAPSHRRAVGVLHLNYWAHVVLVTRPFLLWSALRRWQEQQQQQQQGVAAADTTKPSPEKQRHFAALSSACVAAAEQALALMRAMGAAGALSSVVNFDCSCLLEMVQIFRLALVMETPTPADDQGGGGAGVKKKVHAQIVESVEVLRGMENVGWTSQALPELEVQLRECAVFNREEDEALVLGVGQQQQQQQQQQQAAEGSMEVEDTLGAFFGDVLGEGPAGGGAFGDSYNNLLFLEIDFTS
ncbi:Transcription factor [Botryosphaeria dothidea]|uniref:Transcription factor n=1 Tax=Botryosphaeria dothidea TaxID=55169 RepID=A0A8H4J009_9PEZI|nr:Transcription factor [Botryosphaeria dothidea]